MTLIDSLNCAVHPHVDGRRKRAAWKVDLNRQYVDEGAGGRGEKERMKGYERIAGGAGEGEGAVVAWEKNRNGFSS